MGYYTSYTLTATNFVSRDEAEFFEFKLLKISTYQGWNAKISQNGDQWEISARLLEVKWYDYKIHAEDLSKSFPHVTIDIEGVGEDHEDRWLLRARAGEVERVKAIITFPEFKKLY